MATKAERFLYEGYSHEQEQNFKELRERLTEKLRQNAMKRPDMLANTLPKAISAKLGIEKTAELCIKHGYRSRRSNHITKCPECGSSSLLFRKGETDGIRGIKCRKCKHVEPCSKI